MNSQKSIDFGRFDESFRLMYDANAPTFNIEKRKCPFVSIESVWDKPGLLAKQKVLFFAEGK